MNEEYAQMVSIPVSAVGPTYVDCLLSAGFVRSIITIADVARSTGGWIIGGENHGYRSQINNNVIIITDN